MKRTIIQNGTIVTMNARRDILQGSVLIENDRIKKIGRMKPQDFEGAKIIPAEKLTVIPGFIQTHVHLCQVLFRNHADDLELLDWLKLKIWPFEAAHNPHSISVSAQLGIAELIMGGTTTILDMGTVRHTDHVFEQIEQSGIRAFCGKAMMDQCGDAPKGLQEKTDASLKETERLIKTWHNRANGRIRYALAPRFVLSCSERLLKEANAIATDRQLLYHTHASENRDEVAAVKQQTGMSNIGYFDHIGIMNERLCLAHCIWLSDEETEMIRRSKTKVLHCPSANLKLGSGIARIPEMLDAGITVSIGADGAPCNNNLDAFHEMRLAALIQKPRLGPTAMNAEQVMAMATINGARALGVEPETGSIEINKKADIVLLDLNQPHAHPFENIYSQIVYSAKSSDVQTVMIDGKIIMKNRELKTLDIEKVFAVASIELRKLFKRI